MIYLYLYIYNFFMTFINSKFIYYFLTLPIFIFIFGFRDNIGVDWIEYEKYFYNLEMYDSSFEIGYYIINILIKNITENFNILILITFLFTAISYFINIDYFTPNRNIAIIAWMGINLLSFGIIRQMIAISIFFYALRYTNNKKKYFVYIFIATLFHKSSIFLFPLVYFIEKKHTVKMSISIILISIFIYILNIDRILLEITTTIPIIGDKVLRYVSDSGNYGKSLGLDIRFIEAIILYILCTVFKKTMEHKYKYFNIFYNLLILYLAGYLCFNNTVVIAVRSIKYFELGHIILFSYLIGIFKNDNLKFIFILFIFTYFGLRYYVTLTGGLSLQNNSVIFFPYKNYLYNCLIQNI